MRDIEDLGAEIEHAWRDAQYRAEEFAAIAQAALERRALPAHTWVERIFRWFLSAPQIPHQPPHFAFGEPPIQLYAGRRFYIEALFWTDGTTAIHEHCFSGAFQVLMGGSIHTTYRFERTETISRELVLGKLAADRSELLRAGDIRPIVSGDRFIHSLFHLERPSLTLVVRTRHDAGSGPQYVYRPPGIAYDPFIPDERAARLLRLLEVLDPQRPETSGLLAEMAASADLGSVVAMLVHWCSLHPIDPGACDALLAIVGRRHRALAESLRAAIQEARRQALIIHRRRSHRRPEHRFFLAMLLHVGDREQILQLVTQQFPGADPIELIMTWVEELVTAPSGSVPGTMQNAGLEYDLGEAELKILHHLLRRRTPEQVVMALNEEYDEVEDRRPEILDLCASLTRSALFQPLFRMSP
ncbi:MAG TPA: hypothetical protein VF516_40660 [Kofleriaceae bacterium]